MLEHRVSTSSSIHNREHHAIFGAKFSIARIHSNLLPRPDLIRRVEEASTRELVLRSTRVDLERQHCLLVEFMAWLSLDEDDKDPTHSRRYIVAG
jgi:ATP/maltotriose-dependent transcriptional regulator MalT